MNRRDLPDAFGPVPVRQNVRHRQVGTPARLINVEAVFWEAGQINDAEIRTARGHFDFAQCFQFFCACALLCGVGKVQQIGRIGVVGRGFAEIIEARPHEFTSDERILVLTCKFLVWRLAQPGRIKVVGTDLKIGAASSLSLLTGKKYSPRELTRRSGFAAEKRLIADALREICRIRAACSCSRKYRRFSESRCNRRATLLQPP